MEYVGSNYDAYRKLINQDDVIDQTDADDFIAEALELHAKQQRHVSIKDCLNAVMLSALVNEVHELKNQLEITAIALTEQNKTGNKA